MPSTGRPAALQAPWPAAVGAVKGANGAGVGRATGVFGAGEVEGVVTGLMVVVGGLTRAGVPLLHAAQIRARQSTKADAVSRALTEPGAVTSSTRVGCRSRGSPSLWHHTREQADHSSWSARSEHVLERKERRTWEDHVAVDALVGCACS